MAPPKPKSLDIAAPYVGFDRITLYYESIWHAPEPGSKDPKKRNPPEPAVLVDWMNEMYLRSNFDFCGLYLALADDTHQNAAKQNEITGSARNERNGFPKIFPKVVQQGWGLALFYFGYSIRIDIPVAAPPELLEPNKFPNDPKLHKFKDLPTKSPDDFFPESLAIARGKIHGDHLKRIVATLKPDNSGAVVYLDNEGSTPPFPKTLLAYFKSLFDEMRRIGGENEPPAVRPGLYTFDDDWPQYLKQKGFEDLFVWHLDFKEPGTYKWTKFENLSERPWDESGGRLTFKPEDFPVTAMQFGKTSLLPVGRQGLHHETYSYFSGGTQRLSLPKRRMSQVLKSINDFDINISLVRDPRFPEANPRFRMNGSTLIRGDYRKLSDPSSLKAGAFLEMAAGARLPDAALLMVIRDAEKPDAGPIDEKTVEPEAPIILPTEDLIITVNKSGGISSSSRTSGTWGKMTAFSTQSDLRRIRAITSVTAGPSGIQLFYITRDRKIQVQQLSTGGQWSDPKPLADGVLSHPFSNVSSNYFAGIAVDAFFIDSDGRLRVASWALNAKEWPAQQHKALDGQEPQTPDNLSVLLAGTAIAAVATPEPYELVFAVGRDLRLYMASCSKDGTWTALEGIGEKEVRLFAHTRLAAYNSGSGLVQVAAISDSGDPVVYSLKPGNKKWILGGPRINCAIGPDLKGWNVNPFGDIALGSRDGDDELLCAGTSPGYTGLLMKKFNKQEKWERIVGGEKTNGVVS